MIVTNKASLSFYRWPREGTHKHGEHRFVGWLILACALLSERTVFVAEVPRSSVRIDIATGQSQEIAATFLPNEDDEEL